MMDAPQPFISFIVARAAEKLAAKKVWLFGSRARGRARSDSDFDLAVSVPTERQEQWPAFCAEMEEDAPTLHQFDLVLLEKAAPELKRRILKEGKLIYERKRRR